MCKDGWRDGEKNVNVAPVVCSSRGRREVRLLAVPEIPTLSLLESPVHRDSSIADTVTVSGIAANFESPYIQYVD